MRLQREIFKNGFNIQKTVVGGCGAQGWAETEESIGAGTFLAADFPWRREETASSEWWWVGGGWP